VHKYFWSVLLFSPVALASFLVGLAPVNTKIARADLPELKWDNGKNGFSQNINSKSLFFLTQPMRTADYATFPQAVTTLKTASALKFQQGLTVSTLILVDSSTSVKASDQTNLQKDVSQLDKRETRAPFAWVSQMPDIQSSDTSLELGNLENITDNGMAQITNVSQLRDVEPTDWTYEALRSLVEKYGCIAGYADGTFRGNRALSRYEFAAGLNACLQQVERLIAANGNNIAREDLDKLRRLSDEFVTELGSVRSLIGNLEERTTFLENHQFSITTKLNGLAWFNVTGATAGRSVKYEAAGELPGLIRFAGRGADGKPIVQRADDPNITLSALTWLTFNTSFTGKDSLVTQLATGNGISPANQFASAGLFNTFGSPYFDQTAGPNNGTADVIVRELFYQFPINQGIQLVVGPRINWHRFFDYNAFTFIFTGANTFNSQGTTVYDPIDRGSGAVALLNINKQLELHVGYLGENNEYLPSQFGFNTASDPKKGLFGGTNVITTELTYKPSSRANIRLAYSHINLDNNGGVVSGEPIYGVADDGQGGSIEPASSDAFGINFDWLITPRIGVFGRYGYATTQIDPVNPVPAGNINSQAFQLGLGFPDLGKQGALGTLSFLVPFDVLKGRKFLVAGGGNGGTQYEIEATYFYPLTNNIALVPAFYIIGNANNFDDNPTIYVGNLRTQFSF
jgi:hypothetical protein